ncbi:MAG: hypothetical protein IKQ30_03855 [Bacteroidales bacterium]|nr:hypothetical protein [Bacteroidales bacterium]MBR3713722.1 hypothetical protein [Bacteroidales bacterium]MBR4271948.1 hypothetical protein [Bacteroidales bacterium]
MKIRNILIALVASAVLYTGCHDDDDMDAQGNQHDSQHETVVNVDVILPQSVQKDWSNSINWAMRNIEKAQLQLDKRVKLNLRYHDEDTENLDNLAHALTHPKLGEDSCHAIIGPYHSYNAQTILGYAASSRLPVVMPTCSSAELQRIYARSTNAWFLTESDITQCEMLLAVGREISVENVALIYSDDSYGNSFRDWFGFMADEYKLNMMGLSKYKSGDDLTKFLDENFPEPIEFDPDDVFGDALSVHMCIAISDPKECMEVVSQIVQYQKTHRYLTIFFVCTDTAYCEYVEKYKFEDFALLLGIAPTGAISRGFPQAYESKFGRRPYNGEAQVYDALSIIALGAAKRFVADDPNTLYIDGKKVEYNTRPYTPTLTDWMRSIVADEEGTPTYWQSAGLASTFNKIANNEPLDVYGASGDLLFDQTTHTSITRSNYMFWYNFDNKFTPIVYLSSDGGGESMSTSSIWEWKQNSFQEFDEFASIDETELPAVTDNWAIVISPSTTWANYRHQADAFAMYQLLKEHGYDDEHIILIVEDNLAFDEKNNKYRGQIFVELSDDASATGTLINNDVRAGAIVDYKFSDLNEDDIADIMLGKQSERLPEVFHTTNTSNVFFFWSGHGGDGVGPLWGNENARSAFGTKRIKDIVTDMNINGKYRRMMFAIETCFSGLWGDALTGMPNVVVITAANQYEPSKADVHNDELGVFLSNAFSRSFRLAVDNNYNISLRDLYYSLARTTTGSHVKLFNEENYGSVYKNGMKDYMIK